MKKWLSALAVAGAMVLTGCANKQLTPQANEYLNNVRNQITTQPIAVVSNSCVSRSEVGESYFLLKPSEVVLEKNNAAIVDFLKENKINSKSVTSDIFCYGLVRNEKMIKENLNFKVAKDIGEEKRDVVGEVLLRESLLNDAYNNALIALFKQIDKHELNLGLDEKKPLQAGIFNLTDEQVSALKAQWGTPWALRIFTGGTDVSAGLRWGVGLTTGLITGILTGGTMATVTTYQSNTSNLVAFVNIDEKKIYWKNVSGEINRSPIEQKFDREKIRNLLAPVIAIKDAK